MSIDENLMNDFRIFLEALPADLGRGSLNGMRVQLLYKVRANLQAAKPEQAQTAVGLPEPDFDALARVTDTAALEQEVAALRAKLAEAEKDAAR